VDGTGRLAGRRHKLTADLSESDQRVGCRTHACSHARGSFQSVALEGLLEAVAYTPGDSRVLGVSLTSSRTCSRSRTGRAVALPHPNTHAAPMCSQAPSHRRSACRSLSAHVHKRLELHVGARADGVHGGSIRFASPRRRASRPFTRDPAACRDFVPVRYAE
jgi:hypothetical protein